MARFLSGHWNKIDLAKGNGIAVLYPVTNRTRLHARFAYERKMLAPKAYFTLQEIDKISDAIVAQNRGNVGEYPERDYLETPNTFRPTLR